MIEFKLKEDLWPADAGTEGLLADWLVSEGDFVEEGEIILEAVFVKTNFEIPSPVSGIITEICIQKNERFKENIILAKIDETTIKSRKPDETPLKEDRDEVKQKVEVDEHKHETLALSKEGEMGLTILEKKPLSGIRKIIAERMTESWQTAPQVTEVIKVDFESLVLFSEEKKKEWAKDKNSAVKTSLEDFIIKAYALALEENRQFNSGILDGEMLVYGEINIGFAVDTPGGLMVPVITDTNKKTIPDIALTRASLVEKAVQGKLSDNDIQNVTSTVSNLGMIGIETFTPVLNPPLAIILGIGVVMQETVVVDGEIQPRHTGRLCLTFDHRAVDGYPAAQFLNVIKEKLENPEQLV